MNWFKKKKKESLKERFCRIRYGDYPDLLDKCKNNSFENIEKEYKQRREQKFPTYSI